MGKKLYVGNLSFACTDDDLRELFEPYGKVESARVIIDREKGRSKGFGFVEMADEGEADTAVGALNKKDFMKRPLTVNPARPPENNGQRGGRGMKTYGQHGG